MSRVHESQKIKIIDFRNARYQGKLDHQQQFNGLGILLDDQHLFCMGQWANGELDGQCFIVYPNQQIFYGQFINGLPNGICCFDTTDTCRVFCYFQDGKIVGNVASMFESICYIVELSVMDHGKIDIIEQINYGGSPQNRIQWLILEHEAKKWEIAQKIIRRKIPADMKLLPAFLQNRFVKRYQQLDGLFAVNSQCYVGFQQFGLGVKLQRDNKLKAVGYLDNNKIFSLMGKKIINRAKNVRQQGLYHKPETLVRYQDFSERPLTAKKNLRNFYRQSFDFINKFIKLGTVDDLKQLFNKIKWNIKQNTIQRIAQQLLENPIPPEYSYSFNQNKTERDQRAQLRKTPPKDTSKSGGSIAQISLQKLKQELNRSTSKKKYRNVELQNKQGYDSYESKKPNKDRSPYKVYDPKPAELNYTSRKRQNPQQIPRNYNKQQVSIRYTPSIDDELSKIKIESSSFTGIVNDDSSRKSGTIKSNKQFKPLRKTYKYEQQSTETGYKKHPERIYANIQLSQPNPMRSKSPIKNVSPYKLNNTKLDQISSKYDEYQSKEQRLKAYDILQKKNNQVNPKSGQDQVNRNQYSRNHARKYHYRDHEDYKNSDELTGHNYKTSKKHEVPERSKSPYDAKHTANVKYNADSMDRTSSYTHYRKLQYH